MRIQTARVVEEERLKAKESTLNDGYCGDYERVIYLDRTNGSRKVGMKLFWSLWRLFHDRCVCTPLHDGVVVRTLCTNQM